MEEREEWKCCKCGRRYGVIEENKITCITCGHVEITLTVKPN